jgi:hypothetical protein
MCGAKSRISTRKERTQTSRSTMLRMKSSSRYRAECDGEWKCEVTAKMNMTSVMKAATGCTTNIVESVFRVD